MAIRIAMISGPRNISTAMMRSWEARGDCAVVDEPFYGRYLLKTGAEHPGREQVLALCETDATRIAASLVGPVPGDAEIFYQKHMAHHFLDGDSLAWLDACRACFLIRSPRDMITSFSKVIGSPTIDDMGLRQQVRLFERVKERTGATPPVLDSRDVLLNPRGVLEALCEQIGVAWTDRMLTWPPGSRNTDGIWSKYWYSSVNASTGFAPFTEKTEQVRPHLRDLLDECNALYEELAAFKITT